MPQALDWIMGSLSDCAFCDAMLPKEAASAPRKASIEPYSTESVSDSDDTRGANSTTMPTMPNVAPSRTRRPERTPKNRRESRMFIQTSVEKAIAHIADVM